LDETDHHLVTDYSTVHPSSSDAQILGGMQNQSVMPLMTSNIPRTSIRLYIDVRAIHAVRKLSNCLFSVVLVSQQEPLGSWSGGWLEFQDDRRTPRKGKVSTGSDCKLWIFAEI